MKPNWGGPENVIRFSGPPNGRLFVGFIGVGALDEARRYVVVDWALALCPQNSRLRGPNNLNHWFLVFHCGYLLSSVISLS